LRCLLEIKRLFERSDQKYHLNRLYIDDYCIWIQKIGRKKLKVLSKHIQNAKITKEMISDHWNLIQLEKEAIDRVLQSENE
jgi:protein SHQ1